MDHLDFNGAVEKLASHLGLADCSLKRDSLNKTETATLARERLSGTGYRMAAEFYFGDDLRKVRFEHATRMQAGKNRPGKTFRWEHRDSSGNWQSGDGGKPKHIYLNQVFRGRDENGTVLGVEGEAKCDLAGEFGFAAFSYKELTLESAKCLQGADVFLWPDADEPGTKAAKAAAKIIALYARTIHIVDSPDGIPEGGDIVDAIQTLGWDAEAIRAHLATGQKSPIANEATITQAGSTLSTCYPAPLGAKAYYGVAGEFVRLVEPHSEADSNFTLIQFLVYAGNLLGREAYVQAGGDRHHTNLFVCGVGPTSTGRKGSATGPVQMFFQEVDEAWVRSIQSGLSSGEGLIWSVRDPISQREKKPRSAEYADVVVDEGVSDKRLLVQQSEFYGALQVMRRQGNTLSPTIRDAWDRGNLNSMVKNSPARANGAHISIVGNVTKEELLRGMLTDEMDNGFANRFLWACSRRSKCLPEGGRIWEIDFDPLRDRLRNAIGKVDGRISRNAASNALWGYNDQPSVGAYADLTRERHGMFGTCTARAAAQVLRLSLLYALLDASTDIRPEHLLAALEVWRYCEESARYIFGEALGAAVADEILRNLESSPSGLARNEIVGLFSRHKNQTEINRALVVLYEAGLARSEKKKTNGRPTEQWFAVTGDKK